MICSKCQYDQFKTIRTIPRNGIIIRDKICTSCDRRFFTVEIPVVERVYSQSNMKANPKLFQSENPLITALAKELFPDIKAVADND